MEVTHSLSMAGAVEQIEEFARFHAGLVDRILGAPDEAFPTYLHTAAQRIVTELEQDYEGTALMLREVMGGFPDEGEADFWSTPVGQQVYRLVGYGNPVVPRGHAVHILGVSRQRVSQLEQEGILVSTPDGEGLTEQSVRGRWEVYPHPNRRQEALDKAMQEG